MDEYYNIKDLDKDHLLEELWNSSTNQYNTKNHKFNIKIAKMQLQELYPDYICGRPIKVDIYNSNYVSGYLYDRENGLNAFYNVLIRVRGNKPFQDISPSLALNEDSNNSTYREAIELYKELFL